jgi:hypothetical protein
MLWLWPLDLKKITMGKTVYSIMELLQAKLSNANFIKTSLNLQQALYSTHATYQNIFLTGKRSKKFRKIKAKNKHKKLRVLSFK